jgi:hypothetical protein
LCLQQEVTPLPITSRIKSNILCLFNYRLSDELAKVLGKDVSEAKTDQEHDVENLWLHDNFLTDNGFAAILDGLSTVGGLKSISYTQNELGDKSCEKLCNLIETSSYFIDSITLTDLKESKLQQSVKTLSSKQVPLFRLIG